MRKRDADAGSVKRPEAVDPQNGEVADCKESEEEKKEVITSPMKETDSLRLAAMSGSSPTGRNSEVLKTKAANARPITGIQARKPV